jgi:pilus assembly protein Flp/PilA
MNVLLTRLRVLRVDRRAVTALEYGIIASALAFVLIAVFFSLSTVISAQFSGVTSKI